MRMSSFAMMHRDGERERRAHSLLTLDPDPPAAEFHKFPTEGQPQPRALHLLGRRPHLAELLEDLLLIFWSDADPGVAYRDLDQSVLWRRPNVNPPTLGRELDCVR